MNHRLLFLTKGIACWSPAAQRWGSRIILRRGIIWELKATLWFKIARKCKPNGWAHSSKKSYRRTILSMLTPRTPWNLTSTKFRNCSFQPRKAPRDHYQSNQLNHQPKTRDRSSTHHTCCQILSSPSIVNPSISRITRVSLTMEDTSFRRTR